MKIQKRTLPMYILLNCLTLGVYGFVVARQMEREINALCKGDKQTTCMSYGIALLFATLVPVYGVIYYNYWWYQQANRLKLNANRYGITVRESGTEVFLMRTAAELPLLLITVLSFVVALIVPLLITWLFALIHPVVGIVIGALFVLTLLVFWHELTAGSFISMYYMMKNLNRFADVSRGDAAAFDPMAYEYYPSVAVKYPAMVGGVVSVAPVENEPAVEPETHTSLKMGGVLVGEKGTCAGYKFDLNPGEEIIIGKDAKVSSVVIDPAYKEISRKHVGVTYDIVRDQYCVVDYSSNGTWANGRKLTVGQAVYLPHGTVLELANAKNRFLLG